jgi:murein DD-endopeptidase
MRKTRTLLLILIAAAVGVVRASGAPLTADFTGKWALDSARSTGLAPGMEQTVVVEQNGDTLRVATTLVTDNADRVIDDLYELGAGERDFPPQMPGLTPKVARRTARRTGERTLEVSDHIEGENVGGPATFDIVRNWELSADGKTLTIDQAVTNFGFTTRSHRVLVQGGGGQGGGASAPAVNARMFPVDLAVPIAPTAFRSNGKTNLVYELHVTSFRGSDVEWKRLDVLADDGRPLASYSGAELEKLLTRPGLAGTKEPRRIGAGLRAVAFLWIPIDGPAPAHLRHRAAFTIPASAAGSERLVEGADVAVRPSAVVIGPPVRGGAWVVRWMSDTSFHRRGLMAVDGGARIAQRFAIDWNRFAADGAEWKGEGKENADYSVYGQEVIAVADAVVARAINSIPENVPGSMNPAVTAGIETATGNCVVLRLAEGAYATYAHLKTGSVRVKEGQRVHRGDVLGLTGNSGNATGPHLHFHLSTGPILEGEGLPYVFDSFEVVGKEDDTPGDGQWSGGGGAPVLHQKELPAEHMVLRFQ